MSNWVNMQAPNLGLLFYKHIYKEPVIRDLLQEKDGELSFNIDDKNPEFNNFYQAIYNYDISSYNIPGINTGNAHFELYTTYPGILIGSGYAHDTKSPGDFKIGFYFDNTTGLPTIPGSSVKGVLRSLFEVDVNPKNGKNYTGEKSIMALQFIFDSILSNETNLATDQVEELNALKSTVQNDLPAIKESIFGTEKKPGNDVFFDGVIASGKGLFLSSDFITPHHQNLLQNPTPLQFLKVLPDIIFRFNFRLSDAGYKKIIKELIFKHILLTIGIGAKTNVGYGQFSRSMTPKIKNVTQKNEPRQQRNYEQNQQNRSQTTNQNERAESNRLQNIDAAMKFNTLQKKELPFVPEDNNWPAISQKMKGTIINATVLEALSGSLTIKPHVKSGKGNLKVNGKADVLQVVKIKVVNITGSEKNGFGLEIDRTKVY